MLLPSCNKRVHIDQSAVKNNLIFRKKIERGEWMLWDFGSLNTLVVAALNLSSSLSNISFEPSERDFLVDKEEK